MTLGYRFVLAIALVAPTRAYLAQPRASSPQLVIKGASTLIAPSARDSLGEFGSIRALAASPAGNLFVLDSDQGQVRVLTGQGALLSSAGQPGLRDGELAVPRAIALEGESKAHIYDARTARVSTFSLSGERQLRFVRSQALPGSASSMCLLRGRYVILGWNDTSAVRIYSQTGQQLEAFGKPFLDGSPIMRQATTKGSVVCANKLALVVVVPSGTSEVRAYTQDGVLRWKTEIPGHRRMRIEQRGSTVFFSVPPTGYHSLASAIALTDDMLLLQYEYSPPAGERAKVEPIQSYMLDLRSGAPVQRLSTLPRVIGAAPGVLLVTDSAHTTLARLPIEFREAGR